MTPEPFFDRDLSRRAFLGGGLAVAGGLITAASLGTRRVRGVVGAEARPARAVVGSVRLRPAPTARGRARPRRQGRHQVRERAGRAVPLPAAEAPGGPAPTATAWVKAPLDRAGLPKGRGVYVTAPVLDTAGVWAVEVKAQGETVPFAIQVNAAPVAPVAGQAAPRAASPTVDRHARREPDLHPSADVPAAHGVARVGDRRGQARRRAVRHPGPLPVAVLRPGARRDAQDHGPVPGPHHVRAHRDLPGAHRHRARADRVRMAPRRASRGCSASTAPASSSRASTARSAATR